MIIDTHCHLSIDENLEKKINKMKNDIIIVSGYNYESNKLAIDLSNKYNNIYATIGIHPEELNSFTKESITFIEKNIKNKKVVGIGEIGLDYHYTKDTKETQKKLFIKQLDIAKENNKSVVIHSRDAHKDTFDILKNYKDIKKVLHCYSGSLELALEYIKINTLLGIGGIVTFKNASNILEIVKNINIEYILLETDSPYLTPEPFRGTENEPYNVYLVAKKISEIKNISVEKVIDQTTKNAKSIFDLEI